jgi:hypothetical protein
MRPSGTKIYSKLQRAFQKLERRNNLRTHAQVELKIIQNCRENSKNRREVPLTQRN